MMLGTRGDDEEPTLDLCRPSNGRTAGYSDGGRGFNPRGAPPMNGGADVRWRSSPSAIEAVSPADGQEYHGTERYHPGDDASMAIAGDGEDLVPWTRGVLRVVDGQTARAPW